MVRERRRGRRGTGSALAVLSLTGALLGLLAPPAARAELNEVDDVPAATLLLPYFEVDLDHAGGVNTLFSVNNASAAAILANVTLWTDRAIPVLSFQVYLTGYDVQRVDLREVLRGHLPRTADAGADPDDAISPKGAASADVNFPGPVGPCAAPYPASIDTVQPGTVAHLRAALTGQPSPIFGGLCSGRDLGDGLARGYVTVDTVSECNFLTPDSPGYFFSSATGDNVLWGDYQYVEPRRGTAVGDALVHIEAAPGGYLPGSYTFYGRYVAGLATDGREPLATTFAVPYVDRTVGRVRERTQLTVWRDTKKSQLPFACDATPDPFPLSATDIIGFDEAENPTDLLNPPIVVPPPPPPRLPFPAATQKVAVGDPELPAPAEAGWLYLNLNTTIVNDPFPGVAQGWVTVLRDLGGRQGIGYRAIPLDTASVP